jgi:N-succinyldiaminopimelate aminotransferase
VYRLPTYYTGPVRPLRLRNVPSIGVDRVGDEADAVRDPTILRMENLDTDLRPPQAALDATRRAIDDDSANSYLPFLGHDALREAATAHVAKLSGQSYDWRRSCVITAGACSGILNSLLAMLDPGDEVILTDPIYVGLLNRVRIAGGEPRLVPLLPSAAGWRLDLDALARAGSHKTRVVLMVSPSMPSGAALNAEEWNAVAELCRATGAWLLYDAAQERILYDGRPYIHPASLPGMKERTITVGTVTKEYRMIGWRVGWVVGPPEIVADIGLVSISNVVCQVGIAQAAAAAALTSPKDGVVESIEEWQRRRDLLMSELEGLPVIPADGGWCVLMDVSKLGFDSTTASRRLMEIGRIAATPMINWGSEASDRYIRFVFSNEPCERLREIGERVRSAIG